jgi:mono/diheme cytochrome c family protein
LALASAGVLRAQQPSDAAATYAKTCAPCHGAKGTPAAGMARAMHIPDLAAAAVAATPDSVLRNAIANGKTGTSMTAYKTRLTAAQIAALVSYIRTFSRHQ